MNGHLNELELMRLADGEDADNAHVHECARCANALVEALRMKRAVREAVPRYELPPTLRVATATSAVARRPRAAAATLWLPLAAAVVILFGLGLFTIRRDNTRELVDLHTTIVGGTNPIDVVSTDRHTVKPWFEGKVPFAVNVPELTDTPFRLAGGRVVFWRGRPVAYLLVTKSAHKISLFVMDGAPALAGSASMTVRSWRANGLDHIAVGDVPRSDLEALEHAFGR